MIALGIGAGRTAFNYLFGQSLDASKYVTSTMLFVYIVIIIGMVWIFCFSNDFATQPSQDITFLLSGGRAGGGAGGSGDGANYPHRWQQYYGVDFEISDLQQQLCAEFH